MASRRSAQLAIWRRIAAKSHSPDDPVSEHIAFIKDRVGELDSLGFNWSKESVLGTFFQVGLPSGFPISFEHANDLIDDKLNPAIAPELFNAAMIEEVIEAEEKRMKSSQLMLMSLPQEILENIAHHVQLLDPPVISTSLMGGFKEREWEPGLPLLDYDAESALPRFSDSYGTVCRCCGDFTDECNCRCYRSQSSRLYPNSESRRLSRKKASFSNLRSLASTNRELREICAKFIWKVCTFYVIGNQNSRAAFKHSYTP